MGFPGGSDGKESAYDAGDPGSTFWVRRIPWRGDRLPTPVSLGFPGDSDGKESACGVGGLGSIPGLGRSPVGGHGNPLWYSCLENPHGLVGYSPWGCRVGQTERLSTHTYKRELNTNVSVVQSVFYLHSVTVISENHFYILTIVILYIITIVIEAEIPILWPPDGKELTHWKRP